MAATDPRGKDPADQLQHALRYIESQGRGRDEGLAAYLRIDQDEVPALLKDAVDSRFLTSCQIRYPSKPRLTSHEYRLSESVTAASWPAWHQAYQARINPPSFAQGLDEQAQPAVAKNTGSTPLVTASLLAPTEGRAVAKAPGKRGLPPSSPARDEKESDDLGNNVGKAMAAINRLAEQHPTHIRGVSLLPGPMCQIQIDMDDRTLVLTAGQPTKLAA